MKPVAYVRVNLGASRSRVAWYAVPEAGAKRLPDLPEGTALYAFRETDLLRAMRLADRAAASSLKSRGHRVNDRQWSFTREQLDTDPLIGDCVDHLVWRGLATAVEGWDGLKIILEEVK
jgi:hypothetical protein